MTHSQAKRRGKDRGQITLSMSRDIPFDKLVLSQSNVRRIKTGVSIEELAADIARRTLLQSLTVRPLLGDDGCETGMFEIPAGGRRYRALELLIQRKQLASDAPIPCVIRTEGLAEEDSLAENVQRAPLHPLDQFRAFLAMREKGMGEEEIAAAFFVSANVVRQRLRLAAVSPKLLEVYAEDGLTLNQLMAFTVNPDHERQDAVWGAIQQAWQKEPYQIRRMLTENSVRASDKRARFIGTDTYQAAGGVILRDLFEADDGGWLQDVPLLERLVALKLEAEVETLRSDGWKWIDVAVDFPYGHTFGLRRLMGETVELDAEGRGAYDVLKAEYDQIEAEHDGLDELPDEVDARLGEIETAMEAFQTRPVVFDLTEKSRAGVFVSLDAMGGLRMEADEVDDTEDGDPAGSDDAKGSGPIGDPGEVEEEDDTIRPLPDRLISELTGHRTLALRDALAKDPELAFVAALHVFCLKLFYPHTLESCLEIDPKSAQFSAQVPGLADCTSAHSITARHEFWQKQMPGSPGDLWDVLVAQDVESRSALFAHCISQSLNAVSETWNRRPKALAHADLLATCLNLDMASVGWHPTADNYLGRVTNARILQAVREAKGEGAARLIDYLKKAEMVAEAETLLTTTGWLPEPLRTAGVALGLIAEPVTDAETDAIAEAAAKAGEQAMADEVLPGEDDRASDSALSTAAE